MRRSSSTLIRTQPEWVLCGVFFPAGLPISSGSYWPDLSTVLPWFSAQCLRPCCPLLFPCFLTIHDKSSFFARKQGQVSIQAGSSTRESSDVLAARVPARVDKGSSLYFPQEEPISTAIEKDKTHGLSMII